MTLAVERHVKHKLWLGIQSVNAPPPPPPHTHTHTLSLWNTPDMLLSLLVTVLLKVTLCFTVQA